MIILTSYTCTTVIHINHSKNVLLIYCSKVFLKHTTSLKTLFLIQALRFLRLDSFQNFRLIFAVRPSGKSTKTKKFYLFYRIKVHERQEKHEQVKKMVVLINTYSNTNTLTFTDSKDIHMDRFTRTYLYEGVHGYGV